MGMSLFVSVRFILMNSFLAFILGVVLDFAVDAVLAVPVRIVAGAGLELSIVRLHHIRLLCFVGNLVFLQF
jgi:hypothetical protein